MTIRQNIILKYKRFIKDKLERKYMKQMGVEIKNLMLIKELRVYLYLFKYLGHKTFYDKIFHLRDRNSKQFN